MTFPRPSAVSGVVMPLAAPKEVSVTPLGRLASGNRWRTEAMRSYSVPVLMWITRGQGRITLAGTRRGYVPFTLIFLPPGTMHGFDRMGQVAGSVVFLPAGPDLPWPDAPVHHRLAAPQRQMELTQHVDQIQAETVGDADHRELALQSLVGNLAVWLNRVLAAELSDTKPARAKELVAAYTALLDRDFRSGANIGSLAQSLGVTPTHLSRVCKKTSGFGAHELLTNRRLFEARRLLLDTDLPLAEIAQRAGFSSPAYFSRSFKAMSGSTPSAFRGKEQVSSETRNA